MTYGESQQEKFYRHANAAVEVTAAIVGARALMPKNQPPLPKLQHVVKVWWCVMLGCLATAFVVWLMTALTEDATVSASPDHHHDYSGSIFFLVLAVVCFVGGIIHGALDSKGGLPPAPVVPAPVAPPQAPPPKPSTPPPTPQAPQVRVERSVRIVRGSSATTIRKNSERAPRATQSQDNDVVPHKELTIVTGRQRRPTLHTEEHNGHRIEDHRSFDRDLGAV